MSVDLKRSATILEIIISLVTVLGVVITTYVSITVTQARQDEKIKQLEIYYQDINSSLRSIAVELRELNNKNHDVLLQLKDKADRRNTNN